MGMQRNTTQAVLSVVDIAKSYGHVEALRGVTLEVYPGQILALVGDNGAGKSTLVKVLSGRIKPDGGSIHLGGNTVVFNSPQDARRAGVETVYQDLALVDQLSIWRNFFLANEQMSGPPGLKWLDRGTMRAKCMAGLHRMGIVDVESPDIRVSSLSGGERQAVAIARAMYFGAKVLILDEPTAALGANATERVMKATVRAREHGAAVIVISHNIGEIYRVADRYALLEHGELVADLAKGEISLEELIARLVSRHASAEN
jgi:simple sugar transport system ATP-binding protein